MIPRSHGHSISFSIPLSAFYQDDLDNIVKGHLGGIRGVLVDVKRSRSGALVLIAIPTRDYIFWLNGHCLKRELARTLPGLPTFQVEGTSDGFGGPGHARCRSVCGLVPVHQVIGPDDEEWGSEDSREYMSLCSFSRLTTCFNVAPPTDYDVVPLQCASVPPHLLHIPPRASSPSSSTDESAGLSSVSEGADHRAGTPPTPLDSRKTSVDMQGSSGSLFPSSSLLVASAKPSLAHIVPDYL